MKVGIINVTGYAGAELARILHRHPEANITGVTGRSAAGKRLSDVFPHLSDLDLIIGEELTESVDLIFSALPHGASAAVVGPIVAQGMRTIDLSADFRLKSLDEYQEWYQTDHPHAEYVEEAVYGLPEIHRQEIVDANLVAVPGCYPTAAILALAPAVKAGLVDPDIIVDAKSGVSGAGRGQSLSTHFSEVNENAMAYSVDGHRHLPEITQELRQVDSSADVRVTFLTHLIPMTRGILASCYAPLKEGAVPSGEAARDAVRQAYVDFYDGEPFTRVVDSPPMTKHTLGNNDCVIYPTVDLRTNKLIVISCLDNLVKGAAGQAIQDMNVMHGLPESEGLQQLALYP